MSATVKTRKQTDISGKRAAKLRTSYLADEKFTGSETSWSGEETGSEYDRKLREHFFYCNYHYTPKDLKKDVLIYLDFVGCDKPFVKAVSTAYDTKRAVTITTAANLCRAANSGAKLTEAHQAYVIDIFTRLTKDYKSATSDPVVEESKPVAVKVTIQDRMAEKLSEVIGHFEGIYDQVIEGQKVEPAAAKFLQSNNVPQAQVSKIAGHFTKMLNELDLAKSGKDEQLKEAYRHYKTKDFQRHFEFLKKLIEECDAYRTVKQRTRKPRVKKPADKSKLVSKLKYLKSDAALNLASIRPEDIFSATELWVYNTKTRKLGKYVASEVDKTLSVKGSTILGFDESKSVCKTLRKPQDQLKEFMKATKPQLRKFMESIRATETKMNGRVNEQVLLLRVI